MGALKEPALLRILDVEMINRAQSNMKTVNKSCYVLSCRLHGQSLFLQNGKSTIAERGDILYIPYGSTYSQETKQETVIYIHLEAYSTMPNELQIYKLNDPDRVCSLFYTCYDEYKNKNTNYEYRCMAVLYEILSLIHLNAPGIETASHQTFHFAMQYLDAHICESNFTIDELCRATNISRTYFNRLFKEHYDTTPTNYINNVRIKKAKLLLKSGNYSNEEVAFLCGFNDVKYFYVIFKKLIGQTSSEYKNTEHPPA